MALFHFLYHLGQGFFQIPLRSKAEHGFDLGGTEPSGITQLVQGIGIEDESASSEPADGSVLKRPRGVEGRG